MIVQNPLLSTSTTYPVVYWDDFLMEQEIVSIEKYMSKQPIVAGQIEQSVKSDVRNSGISFVQPDQENQWIFDKMVSIANFINIKFFQYELYGFDHMQYTEYVGNGTKYDYHMDMHFGDIHSISMVVPRKLSFSLILSDSNDYSGGEFQYNISNEDNMNVVTQKRGRIIAFPSFVIHKVNPIISGTRRSLVFWAVGPKFK